MHIVLCPVQPYSEASCPKTHKKPQNPFHLLPMNEISYSQRVLDTHDGFNRLTQMSSAKPLIARQPCHAYLL